MDARTNLSLGTRDFRLFGLCNPDNKNDLAGRFSVPVDGWESVSVDSDFWRTQWGAVRHHDGFKSPAVTERGGAEKYPYLINRKSIDTILREYSGNADAPAVWTMIRGWPPPQGSFSSILTEQLISAFRMAEKPLWLQQYMLIAGLDPAFTSDGDNAILQLAALGLTTDHVLTLGFMDAYKLIIEASSKRPVTYQLLDQVLKLQSELGFSFENLGVDDSGTQSVADIIDAETGCRTFRVNFLNKATDMPVSVVNDIPANKLYANRITEYYFAVSEFGQKNQIRGLPSEAAYEFCQRRLADNKMPRRLERKRDLKLRIKRSPDYADAGAICVGVAREKFGMLAGAVALPQGTFMPMSADDGFDESLLREFDIDGRRNNYQKSGF